MGIPGGVLGRLGGPECGGGGMPAHKIHKDTRVVFRDPQGMFAAECAR